ncbi:MAG: hypothetical protein AAFZ92_03660 [Pseudomonadota bacterium]
MPKAASPVRLEADLMSAASLSGALHKRSAAEQIEYWASIGRNVADVLTPEILLDITNGIAKLIVEPISFASIDTNAVFDALEQDRSHGVLANSVSPAASIRYQASPTHEGYLEQIAPDGSTTVGHFKQGEFIPLVI